MEHALTTTFYFSFYFVCVSFADNIFTIKSWCKKKFFMEEKVIDKQFGIPEDFDYID